MRLHELQVEHRHPAMVGELQVGRERGVSCGQGAPGSKVVEPNLEEDEGLSDERMLQHVARVSSLRDWIGAEHVGAHLELALTQLPVRRNRRDEAGVEEGAERSRDEVGPAQHPAS